MQQNICCRRKQWLLQPVMAWIHGLTFLLMQFVPRLPVLFAGSLLC